MIPRDFWFPAGVTLLLLAYCLLVVWIGHDKGRASK